MIERIRFKNFKVLRDAEVKLGAFNLIVGPNGSGKSTLLQAFEILANPDQFLHRQLVTLGAESKDTSFEVLFGPAGSDFWITLTKKPLNWITNTEIPKLSTPDPAALVRVETELKSARVYALEPSKMAQPVQARAVTELTRTGDNLSGALTYLRDQDEDAYNQFREELRRWVPEFGGIGFINDSNGVRQFYLHQAGSKRQIPASELSEGTLLALGLLSIVYQPAAPILVGLEEPDRGLHPRLMREVRDALYRLSFPNDFGLKRKPVQVVATTHSPLFLDLFKDHPEQIIIAEKHSDGTASFKNLADDPQLREIIGDAPLGEVWYSGVLGGVPALK